MRFFKRTPTEQQFGIKKTVHKILMFFPSRPRKKTDGPNIGNRRNKKKKTVIELKTLTNDWRKWRE